MKKISIVVPTYNEEENIEAMVNAIGATMDKELQGYMYELIFIDNNSSDDTRKIIKRIATNNKCVKAIFNARNFGQNNSPYYGLLQTDGDCAILMSADFQDPVELIPTFVREWEKGYKIVSAIKTSSKERGITRLCRTAYYRILRCISNTEIIEHFTGFGLYDKAFINFMKLLDDQMPFMRGIVAEYGGLRKEIPFEQPKRRAGKSHNNFFSLYDIAMLSFTSYTTIGLRIATFVGGIIAICSFIIALIYLVYKLVFWENFSIGMAPITIGLFFLGATQLIFLGLIGEYIISINQRVKKRPLVIETERINF